MAPYLSPLIVTGGCGFIGFHLVKGLLAQEPHAEIRTFGKGRPRVTWEAVRLTTITLTLNGERFQRVTGYQPGVSIRDGLAIAGK